MTTAGPLKRPRAAPKQDRSAIRGARATARAATGKPHSHKTTMATMATHHPAPSTPPANCSQPQRGPGRQRDAEMPPIPPPYLGACGRTTRLEFVSIGLV
eukprot:scaffold21687_cov28-Tisochrysis_lutea.AAC.1